MGYQYHIGVVAIPELLTPNITMAMTSVSVNEGITHWTMDQWDKVFLVNITGDITIAICIVLYWDFSFIFEAIETHNTQAMFDL